MTDEKPIERFKALEDLTPQEHHERMTSGRLPETPEYRAERKRVLLEAGLEDDTPGPAKDLADMTAEDHYNRLGANR